MFGMMVTQLRGPSAETVYLRFKEVFKAFEEHECKLRVLVALYLGAKPSTKVREVPHKGGSDLSTEAILDCALENELKAATAYKEILAMLYTDEMKKALPYAWERCEHDIRHIVIDVECAIAHFNVLLGRPPRFEPIRS